MSGPPSAPVKGKLRSKRTNENESANYPSKGKNELGINIPFEPKSRANWMEYEPDTNVSMPLFNNSGRNYLREAAVARYEAAKRLYAEKRAKKLTRGGSRKNKRKQTRKNRK